MSSTFEQFKQLHYTSQLLVLPNAWDAKSARTFQEKQYPAVATSSAAVAESLGYNDGEEIPWEEYLMVIKRILASVTIPVTVDIEMGYATSNEGIAQNLLQLAAMGVAGVNLEDSTLQNGKRILKPASDFAATIQHVKETLAANNQQLFLNVRCDTYILHVPNKRLETRERLPLYQQAGADGIFLPCIAEEADIAAAVQQTQLPINVMAIPGLPSFNQLQQLGVKRASMGAFLFHKTYQAAGELVSSINSHQNFSSIL